MSRTTDAPAIVRCCAWSISTATSPAPRWRHKPLLQHVLSTTDESRHVWQALASRHPPRGFGRHARLADGASNPVPGEAENTGEKDDNEKSNAEEFAHPGEPMQVVTGGSGKPPYAVTHRGPDLKYSASENGFVKIGVGPNALEIDMMNSDGTVKTRFREAPNCTGAIRSACMGRAECPAWTRLWCTAMAVADRRRIAPAAAGLCPVHRHLAVDGRHGTGARPVVGPALRRRLTTEPGDARSPRAVAVSVPAGA